MREDAVDHDRKEDFLGQLKEVVLVERCSRNECGADALASILKLAPIVLL